MQPHILGLSSTRLLSNVIKRVVKNFNLSPWLTEVVTQEFVNREVGKMVVWHEFFAANCVHCQHTPDIPACKLLGEGDNIEQTEKQIEGQDIKVCPYLLRR